VPAGILTLALAPDMVGISTLPPRMAMVKGMGILQYKSFLREDQILIAER
jgi:hypothetical protein